MRVLISGAGIAGPALSWWLSRAGVRSTILEKEPSHLAKGQNVDVRGTAVEILRQMGLLDEVRRCTSGETGTQFLAPDGKPVAFFSADGGGMTAEFEILRGDLAAILYDATKNDNMTTYRFGTTVSEVLSNDDRSVKVRLSTGEVEEYDLLVAADGQWSKIRQNVFRQEEVYVDDKNVYVVYFTLPRVESDNTFWDIYHCTDSRILSTRPDPHGTTRGLLGLMPRTAEQKKAWQSAARADRQTKEDLVRKEFTGRGWKAERLLDGMSTSSEFYFQAFQQIKMSTWSRGRIVCLGDTAWSPTPLSGMGTSLALVGAHVLAGCLSRLEPGQHPAAALNAYETVYRPYVTKNQRVVPGITRILHPQTSLGRRALHATIWSMHAAGTLAELVTTNPLVTKLWALLDPSDGKEGKPAPKKLDFDLPHYAAFEKPSQ